MQAVYQFPSHWDLAAIEREDANDIRLILERVIQQGTHRKATSAISESHDRLHFLPDVLRVSLPMGDNAPKNLLKVHRSAIFGEWHAAFRRAVDHINDLTDHELLDPRSQRTRELREQLLSVPKSISKEASRSRALRRTVTSAGFGIACATGALGSIPNPMITGAVGGAGFLGAQLLQMLNRPNRSAVNAMRLLIPVLEADRPIPRAQDHFCV